jgi:hypothetical protein
MTRARVGYAATLLAAAFVAGGSFAGQAAQAPTKLEPVLAGKTFTPPVHGEAEIEYTIPVTKREKDNIVTRITVRNISQAPIARLQITETFYDKAGAVLISGRSAINGLLQPQEIQTMVIETPFKGGVNGDKLAFRHANGDVKPHKVQKLETAKDTASAPAKPSTAKPTTTKPATR